MINYNKKYLLRLKKRRDFLASRTKSNPNLSHDIAEQAALTWVIDTVCMIYNLDENANPIDIELDEIDI